MAQQKQEKSKISFEGEPKPQNVRNIFFPDADSFYDGVTAVLDCGAGPGTFSLMCTGEKGIKAAYAYDGYFQNFNAILHNIVENSAYSTVPDDHHIHRNTGRKQMHVEGGVVNDLGAGEPEIIETRSIDGLHIPDFDLIKVTVPGAAAGILAGAGKSVARLRPALIVETASPKEEKEVYSILRRTGYSVTRTAEYRKVGPASTRLHFCRPSDK